MIAVTGCVAIWLANDQRETWRKWASVFGQGRKYMACMGTCCGEWMIEFRSDYHQQDSAECMERAIDAWNRAPRMAND